MSEALTPEAPVNEAAVPSVEDQAPAEAAAVASGSAGGEDVVPASRFNGLMSKFNKLQRELEEARQAQAALEALQAQREEVPNVSDVTADEVRLLREELAAMRAESARAKVLEKYPDAKPFADLIVGDSPEDIEAVAKALSERVAALRGNFAAEADDAPTGTDSGADSVIDAPDDATAAAAPVAPVVPGGQAYDDTSSPQSRVADAIARNDFPAYLRAKAEAAMSELG